MYGELDDSPVAKVLVYVLVHMGSILIGYEWLIFSSPNELVMLPPMAPVPWIFHFQYHSMHN
jgi:hypothetical protein